MARRKKEEEPVDGPPRRLWREALGVLSKLKDFTAGDLVKQLGVDYNSAAKLLHRLHSWSHVRVVGFDDAIARNPSRHPGGRRRKVYEITDKGRGAAAWKGGRS